MQHSYNREKRIKATSKIRERSKLSPNECDHWSRRKNWFVKLVSLKKDMGARLFLLKFFYLFVSKKKRNYDLPRVCIYREKTGWRLHNFGEITRFSAVLCLDNGLVQDQELQP